MEVHTDEFQIPPATANLPITHVRAGERSPGGWITELWGFREVWLLLAWRDFRVRYKQAVLGMLWALAQPLSTMLVFWGVFARLGKMPTDGAHPGLFYLSTLTLWGYISNSITAGAGALVSNQRLVTKIYFPRILIPLAAVTSPLADLLLGSAFLFGLGVLGGACNPARLLLLPLAYGSAVLCATALAIGPAAVNAQYRDVKHALPFVTQFLLYISPVAYPASLVPVNWRPLFFLNPCAAPIEFYRWIATGTGLPSLSEYATSTLVAVLLLVLGFSYFREVEGRLADSV